MNPTATTRVDLHCHSTASQLSKLGIQRSVGLPECATPPEEVYDLAKRRGMQFVTITDHDTIDGCLEIADRPDVFISEELTAWFKGEPQAVHVLCLGITPDDHAWLQAHASDVETCAEYLVDNGIVASLAHPFYAVEAPLAPTHRRRLAELFPIWEVRNGSRAKQLNMPAAVYIETHGGTGTGGSDDHAGVDIGRTFTETPLASTPEEFLCLVDEGRADARGEQGSAAKWAHSALALGIRALGASGAIGNGAGPDPDAVLRMAERVMKEGDVRRGDVGRDLGPADARALLGAWLDSVDLERSGAEMIALMQSEDFSHADLYRRARSAHERALRQAVEGAVSGVSDGGDPRDALNELFHACLPVIPYLPAAAFLGKEKAKLASRERGEPRRVALVADGTGSMHGVTHTIEEIRERGVPGFEVEVIGTDARVDVRLPAAAEVDVPFYPGMKIGAPGLPGVVEALAEGRYDLVHVVGPGPSGVAASLIGRIMELPVLGSYHTELAAYAEERSGSQQLREAMEFALSRFYGNCEHVLSPSPASDEALVNLGIERGRIGRWERGVDVDRFSPERREQDAYPGEFTILYAGRLTREKGVDMLGDVFLEARERDPSLRLLLAGGGPEEEELRTRLGDTASFLGWLDGDDLARAYASADAFLFASRTDTFGQVIVEAQASGLPVVAVGEGGPASLIEDGVSGLLCRPEPAALANAVLRLVDSPPLRRRLAAGGLRAARQRSWDLALGQLATGYSLALGQATQRVAPQPRTLSPEPAVRAA